MKIEKLLADATLRPIMATGSILFRDADADLARSLHNAVPELVALVKAARNVSDTLDGGFIVCQRCGDQEETTDIDFADDLRKALAALPPEWREE